MNIIILDDYQDAVRKLQCAQRPELQNAKVFTNTVKGIGNASGVSRFEWEREIPLAEAESLLALCEPGVIDKVRHEVHIGRHVFEVDEFAGSNAGLVLAEIELSSEDEDFARPGWLGAEVTGDLRYYNVMLMKEPYGSWPEQARAG
mgnify:CR=1 FL=1